MLTIPSKPTGQERQDLLDALAKVAPDVVRHEDKAIDAARNQCSARTGSADKLDWLAPSASPTRTSRPAKPKASSFTRR